MNNVFKHFRNAGGQANIPNIIAQFMQVRQNPSQIGQLLYNSGRIDQEQFNAIKEMNDPRQIGEYLMNHNADFGKMIGSTKR